MDLKTKPEHVSTILGRVLPTNAQATPPPEVGDVDETTAALPETDGFARYDFSLAEFPLFRLNKLASSQNCGQPIRYSDTITGRDGKPVARSWTVYPGPFGFGGQSTQVLLFDLLQLYAEQGACGTQIQFGTLRSLFLRRGERNPSKRDYDRMRRDIDILRGYDIHCQNAFWDSARQSYINMKWRLFESVFYFQSGPNRVTDEQPFGFLEVSSVLRTIARTRGLFRLGFDRHQFYSLKPLEQRLALYLAKHFTSQKLHRRFVNDLASVLPIDAERERDVRRILSQATEGLLAKKLPTLGAFRLYHSTNGLWLAEFTRGVKVCDPFTKPRFTSGELDLEVAALVDRIVESVGSNDDRVWWTRCVETFGRGAVDRCLGLLKEAKQTRKVMNPGGLLTKFFKDCGDNRGTVSSKM